ncbi:hypothetical protein [Gordonia sp. (in: high G+C Gram-positive bacteria)]|uniref:hypothetical protein n=1 Tax=Gordonia sp. (in: high G+C Gram-positive bacteria) TaxID=84139 RepID=UPI003C726CA8
MANTARMISTARRAAVVAAAGAAAVAMAGIGTGAANAAPEQNLPENCAQYSQDGGTTWGGTNVLTWSSDRPVPGGEIKHGSFKVKNTCEAPAVLQIYAGNWSISNGGSATVRGNAGSTQGTKKDLVGTPGLLVVQTNRLSKDTPVQVDLFVGIPSSETKQNFTIDPKWSVALEEVAGTPGDGGNGGGGNGGGSGSLDTGSLGSVFGSLGGKSAAKPVVTNLNASALHSAN